MVKYYDGTKLLSMKDINGETPEIFISTTNRSAGKTTYFGRLCVNRFIKKSEKFCLVYRYNYELDGVADKFFKELRFLFFPEYNMISKRRANGIYHELFLCKGEDEESCGYAVALNNADAIRKYSHFFSDAKLMLFDEFQSETNHYCSDEPIKLSSLHMSIARGGGSQVRYLPVIMLSNAVSLLNPHFVAMGISARLNKDTKFLKGDGFVLEQGYNESVAKAQRESAFNRAYSNTRYLEYATGENVYLNDNMNFIEKMSGKSNYLCTLKFKGNNYAIREYRNSGIIYCDDKADLTNPQRLAITTEDMTINYVMLRNNSMFINQLRWYFEKGCFRFKNLQCKEVIMALLSY